MQVHSFIHILLTALVTVLALMVYIWQLMRVGSARNRLGVAAPATTGHPEFERHFRVQANTLESLIIFLAVACGCSRPTPGTTGSRRR